MRRVVVIALLVSTVLAAGIGWTASLGVDSDRLTTFSINQTANIPTPLTLFLDGTPNPDQLLDHQPGSQSTVNLGLLLGSHDSVAIPGVVGSASNASDWQLTLVVTTGLVQLSVNVGVTIYWQDGGTSCTNPVAGQVFAQGSVLLSVAALSTNRGSALTIPATSGNVSRTFDADDLLCLRLSTTLSLLGSYSTGVTATSGPVQGVMSNLQGPVYAP